MIERVVLTLGLVALALITLVYPGATRMFAWPWTLAQAAALLVPPLLLFARALDARRTLVLPAPGWGGAVAATGIVTILSALASPYRSSSLLWSAPLLSALAAHFVAFDWLHRDLTETPARRFGLHKAFVAGAVAVAVVSLGLWIAQLPRAGFAGMLAARNPFPLGHSNYTAGLAVLLLPLAAGAALRMNGRGRAGALAAAGLALALIFSSGSRGALIGLAGVAVATVGVAPWPLRKKFQIGALAALAALVLALAHPRTRASLIGGADSELVAASAVQRDAMLTAGLRMGGDRPLLGWGPGATPLVYPKFRAGLAGGAENVLQLHSTPIQVWAEFGLAGLAVLLVLTGLTLRQAGRDRVALAALAGYGVFSLTDWQLDVPVFAFAIALLTALLAPPRSDRGGYEIVHRTPRLALAGFILTTLALVFAVGRRDPAPKLNTRALALAASPANADQSVALFRASLTLNPDQEIAHFNLGWLLVVRAPTEAERHFLAAARLVPDKGGVYFGIGLARLNQDRPAEAAHAFALECINDPQFLVSPWWREPAIAALRNRTEAAFRRHIERAQQLVPHAASRSLALLRDHAPRLGHVPPGPGKTYRRERTGYPVLMRNLDLPAPVDLFDVRETAAPDDSLPPKGWLPSPVLPRLLESPPADSPPLRQPVLQP